MKIKTLLSLLLAVSCGVIAWLVHIPAPGQADEVPEKYRDTVTKGLEYLVRHQHKDGHWEGDAGKHPVAMTGLVGLALLMEKRPERNTRSEREETRPAKYLEPMRKAVDWLISKSPPDREGLIYADHASERSRYMEGHGLATLFLAGMLREERDAERRKKLHDVLTRAVRYILKAQSTQGGWYHTSKTEGHDFDAVLPTVIQIQALQAVDNVGIAVPADALDLAQDYLKKTLAKAHAGNADLKLLDHAATLVCFSQPGSPLYSEPPKGKLTDDVCKASLTRCQNELPLKGELKLERHELVHYYYAQTVYNLHEQWASYRKFVFDQVQTSQNKDGSWPGAEGFGAGPLYTTALWCTMLQLDVRSHPSIPPVRAVIVTWRPERRPFCFLGPRSA